MFAFKLLQTNKIFWVFLYSKILQFYIKILFVIACLASSNFQTEKSREKFQCRDYWYKYM